MQSDSTRPLDGWTLAALGLLAFAIKCVVHEGLGHGAACMAVGGEPVALSSAWWDGSYDGVSADARRFVRAAGTLANLIAAGLAGLALHRLRSRARRTGTAPGSGADLGSGAFFLWLLLVTNLLSGGGYMMVDPLFGFGDWTAILEDLPGAVWIRWVVVAAGVALSLAGVRLGRRWLTPWLGAGDDRRARSRRLVLVPYLVGASLAPLSALQNPLGLQFAFTSLLSTFGGCAWMVWIAFDVAPAPADDLRGAVERAPGWWLAGALAAAGVMLVLGPSIRFG